MFSETFLVNTTSQTGSRTLSDSRFQEGGISDLCSSRLATRYRLANITLQHDILQIEDGLIINSQLMKRSA
jgi:hypothetical protein